MEPLEPLPAPAPAAAPVTSSPRRADGFRRTALTVAMAAGLLTLGGTAVVLAASPDPSATTAPSSGADESTDDSTAAPDATTSPDGAAGDREDCPEDEAPDADASST